MLIAKHVMEFFSDVCNDSEKTEFCPTIVGPLFDSSYVLLGIREASRPIKALSCQVVYISRFILIGSL